MVYALMFFPGERVGVKTLNYFCGQISFQTLPEKPMKALSMLFQNFDRKLKNLVNVPNSFLYKN